MTGTLIATYSTPLFIAMATLAVNRRIQAMPRPFRLFMVLTMLLLALSVSLSIGISRNGDTAGAVESVFSLIAMSLSLTAICIAAAHLLVAKDDNVPY